MQRFFLNPKNFKENLIIIDDPKILHQISRVLRMKEGERFIALDNSGMEALCVLKTVDKMSARARLPIQESASRFAVEIIEKRKNLAEPEIFVTLYQAMPKKMELFELVLQKGTEIGVSTFIPLITEHTERREITKRERLEKILREAAEQSERGKIPSLSEPIDFEKAVTENFDGISVILHSRGNYPSLSSFVPKIQIAKKCRIFIGPEGGFSEKEIKKAEENDFFIASLGPRILRTETTGIVAVSQILWI